MISAFFYFQPTLNRLFKKLCKVILILDQFFLKYECGSNGLPTPSPQPRENYSQNAQPH